MLFEFLMSDSECLDEFKYSNLQITFPPIMMAVLAWNITQQTTALTS